MTAVRNKWAEMSWFRRILLLWMAAMILGFGAALPVVRSSQGMEYEGGFLRLEQEGEARYYRGSVDGEETAFSVFPDGQMDYRRGEYRYGLYQVSAAPDAVPEGSHGSMTGIEIRQGDELLFRGGYLPDASFPLIRENGDPVVELGGYYTVSDGTLIRGDGKTPTQEEGRAPSLSALARAALGPELVRRGSVGIYLLVTLLALFNAAQICFPGFFFRLSLWGHVRNREAAEPSDFYIFMERAEWVLLALLTPVFYWYSLTVLG